MTVFINIIYTVKTGSQESLLPGCYVTDSREGWHLTYYWFYILEWRMK